MAEQALKKAGDAPNEHTHAVAGLAYAMQGNLIAAITHLKQAYVLNRADGTAYNLASVLACSGDFHRATQIFSKGLKINISEDESTTTQIIALNAPSLSAPPRPFARETTLPLPLETSQPELVVLAACDSRYLRLFGAQFVQTLNEHVGSTTVIHLHVVNPAPGDIEGLDKLSELSAATLRYSTETIVQPSLPDSARKTYYSCARFLVAPELSGLYKCPLLLCDIDQLIRKNPAEVIAGLNDADVGLLKFPHQQFNLLSLFSASVLFASNTPEATRFLTDMQAYLLERMQQPRRLTWHLDQACIAVTYLRNIHLNGNAKIGYIPVTALHSNTDGSKDIPSDCTFWSITYHVSDNAQKLQHSEFSRTSTNASVFRERIFSPEGPKVSLVMPVYNGSNYLAEAIDSALAQTWKNLEIIVVNDGSTDSGATRAIARGYGDQIKYIEKENGGVASALNAGIAAMTGDVFCWLSHDDMHLPGKTESQVRHWESLGFSDCVLYGNYRLIEADGTVITDVKMNAEQLAEKPVYGLLRAAIHGCTIFIPRELFETTGVFDENLPTTQDYDLWARMILRFPFVHMPEIMVLSRWHDEQGSKQLDHQEEANQFWQKMLDLLPPEEQVLLEGTQRNFQLEMQKFLTANNINQAAELAASKAQDCAEGPLVSVIIPVFNRFELAHSAIDSVIKQSYKNIEIIVVNDGSDIPHEHLQQIVDDFPSAIKLLYQENAGPGAARNYGMAEASGEFFAFLDSDDLFLPRKIELQVQEMSRTGSLFSHTSYWKHEPNAKRLARMETGAQLNQDPFPQILTNCPIATPTVMIHRTIFEEGIRFPNDSHVCEDVVTWIRIASQHPPLGITHPMTIVRTDSTSAANDTEKQVQGLIYILHTLLSDPNIAIDDNSIAILHRTIAEIAA